MDCLIQCGPGSVWFGHGFGVERFEWFRFSVPAVPLGKVGSVFQYSLTEGVRQKEFGKKVTKKVTEASEK